MVVRLSGRWWCHGGFVGVVMVSSQLLVAWLHQVVFNHGPLPFTRGWVVLDRSIPQVFTGSCQITIERFYEWMDMFTGLDQCDHDNVNESSVMSHC